MSTATATRIFLSVRLNVRPAPKKGKTDEVTDVGIFLGDMMVAFQTIPGKCTEKWAKAQFRRTAEADPKWQKNPTGWEMYKEYKKLGVV